MGRNRKFKSAKALADAWEDFKRECDSKQVLTHEFSSKLGEFVSKELTRKVTYTIEGFCSYIGISRAAFYEHYANNEKYADIVTRMREECENDAREKFELGIIPTQLSGLWMSKYGYSLRNEVQAEVTGSLKAEASKLDALVKQMNGE